MYFFLDILFFLFHSLLIVFCLFGWISLRTRKAHLLVLSLTMISWFGLGLWYGFGYCPSTDWHWAVKRSLGETGLPNSYVKYCLDELTGRDWNPQIVDLSTAILGLTAFAVSVHLNRRERRRSGRH